MRKTSVIAIILMLAILVAGLLYYARVFPSLDDQSTTLEVLPASTPVIFQYRNFHTLNSAVSERDYFGTIEESKLYQKLLSESALLDSLNARVPEFNIYSANQLQTTALFLTKNGAFDLLYISTSDKGDELYQIAENAYVKIGSNTYKSTPIYQIPLKSNASIFFAVLGNQVVYSVKSALVEKCIEATSTSSTIEFTTSLNDNLAPGTLRCLVNTPHLESIHSLLIAPEQKNILASIGNRLTPSVIDVNFDDQGVILSGKAAVPSSSTISTTSGSEDIFEISHSLPTNVAYCEFHSNGDLDSYPYLQNWAGTNYAAFILESFDDLLQPEFGFAIQNDNAETCLQQLQEWSSIQGENIGPEASFLGYDIYQLATNESSDVELFPPTIMDHLENPYFCLINEHVIFQNNLNNLKQIIDKVQSGRTLAKSLHFIDCREEMAKSSLTAIYIHPTLSQQILRSLSADGNSSLALANKVLFQVGGGANELVYSGKVSFDASNLTASEYLWKIRLDTTALFTPNIVANHNTNAKEILTQDIANTIYLINASGEILWTRELDGPIVGSVSQIDYFKNGKLQYVVNTKDMLYIIDRLGNDVADFPLKLAGKATSGHSLVFYKDVKQYRIFISTDKGHLYGYEQNGKPLTGWSPNNNSSSSKFALQYLTSGGKDYLINEGSNGAITMFKRNGSARVTASGLPSSFHQAFTSVIGDGFHLVNGNAGNVYIVDQTGKVEKIEFGNYSDTARFAAASNRYVFLDGQTLHFHSNDGSKIYDHTFEQAVQNSVSGFTTITGEPYFSVQSYESNEIYLFNGLGTLHPDFPQSGVSNFEMSDLLQTGEDIIVVGDLEGYLYAYRVR